MAGNVLFGAVATYARCVSEELKRVVEGYYECPVPFVVGVSALAVEYSAVVGGRAVVIRLPSEDGVDRNSDELSAPPWHYSERQDLLSSRPELAPFWGRIVHWAENFSAPKAASVRRFGISLEVAGDDDQVRDGGRHIAEAMPTWWAAVSAWIELRHGQDLSQLGPVQPGIKFTGTTLWARLYSLHGHPIRDGGILPVGSSAVSLVWPSYASIAAPQLQRCIDHAQQFGPPGTEWLLIRDANSLCAGQDYRRAMLDAGLAAELAVTNLITAHLTAVGRSADIPGELRANAMLSRRCQYWVSRCRGTLPVDYQSRLIDRRNSATHAGTHFPEADVRDAISVAREIVDQAIPLPP